MMRSKRSSVLLVVKSLLSLLALALVTVAIHEGAHLASAIIMNVPVASLAWFDTNHLAPALVSASTSNTLGLAIVDYAGGMVAGGLLLAILISGRGWFGRSPYRWLLGYYIASLGFWEICQGMVEGAFHDMYVSDAANIFSLASCAGYASVLLGIAVYCAYMPRPAEWRA